VIEKNKSVKERENKIKILEKTENEEKIKRRKNKKISNRNEREDYHNNVKVSKELCTFPWQLQERKHSLVVNTIVSENKSAS